jgi:hypothetical protein
MKLIQKTDNIFQIEAETQYLLCMTFIRLQEFYESPFKDIRGRYFTLERYMDRYANENGNFTYPTDWNGFNVPGNVVRDFFDPYTFNFAYDMSKKEYLLYHELLNLDLIGPKSNPKKKFYLLGTHTEKGEEKNEALDHELAHAFWYLDSRYQRAQKENLGTLSKTATVQIHSALKWLGYTEEVFQDETQAYLSTCDAEYLEDIFEGKWPDLPVKKHQLIKDFYDAYRVQVAKI